MTYDPVPTDEMIEGLGIFLFTVGFWLNMSAVKTLTISRWPNVAARSMTFVSLKEDRCKPNWKQKYKVKGWIKSSSHYLSLHDE